MKLAVIDLETDPFEAGKVPRPFLSGYFDGTKFVSIWDNGDCIGRTVAMLDREEPAIIYAHNGGKFDWFYFLRSLTLGTSMRIINGRIVQATLGHHEIRDSFSIMPFALDKYRKTEIDYAKFVPGKREKYREEITSYLRDDCTALHELITAYWDEFGNVLTVGSAALRELKKLHSYTQGGSEYDAELRGKFYFGGRVQVLDAPIVTDTCVQVYDVNSMYPYVMAEYLHPVSTQISVSHDIQEDMAFIECEGYSDGAFAVRTKTGIDFPSGYGMFATTGHEFQAALDTGCFKLNKVIKTYGFSERINFGAFVHHFYHLRLMAEQTGDKIHKLFYKYVLNSAYGKFAQNPDNYYDYEITGIEHRSEPWELYEAAWDEGYMLWRKPVSRPVYHNIATAASITGAARSVLLRGLHSVERPLYCDTDSIISTGPGVLSLSESELGGWKTEVTASSAYFGGKKIYALFDSLSECPSGSAHSQVCGRLPGSLHCVKKAHKGFKATGRDIQRIAQGGVYEWTGEVPHFSFSGQHGFVTRKIRSTINGVTV